MLRAMTLLAAVLVLTAETASAQSISACVRNPSGRLYGTVVDGVL